MGKSALALNIATNVSVKEKRSVLIFNMEMSKSEIAKRVLASEALIDNQKLSTGNVQDNEWEKIARASETKDTNPLRTYSYRLSSTYRTCV